MDETKAAAGWPGVLDRCVVTDAEGAPLLVWLLATRDGDHDGLGNSQQQLLFLTTVVRRQLLALLLVAPQV